MTGVETQEQADRETAEAEGTGPRGTRRQRGQAEVNTITDEDREHVRRLAREHRATWQAEGRLTEKERRVWRLINDTTRGN